MSFPNRRIIMIVAWLALLSVCLWAAFEFTGLARVRHSAKAASAFCASVKARTLSADAQALASKHPGKKKFDITDDSCASISEMAVTAI